MPTIKLKGTFDLEITVRVSWQVTVERLLIDNSYAFNAVRLVFNNLVEFTIYDFNMKKCDAIRKLLKDAEVPCL